MTLDGSGSLLPSDQSVGQPGRSVAPNDTELIPAIADVRDDGSQANEIGGPDHVRRTLHAIEQLAARPRSVEDLARSLKVHPRTASRMLRAMEQAGWVTPESDDPSKYKLTSKVLGAAGDYLSGMNLVQASAEHVRRLRDRLDETTHIAVPSQGFAVQIYEEQSSHPLAVTIPLGAHVPLHASAIGKALAAHLPDQLDEAVKLGLTRYTPNTITTRGALERELDITRLRGYAVDDEELNPGTRCIAAPVRDPFGRVVAAIGASGPHLRLTRDRVEFVAAAVTGAALDLSKALGWTPPVTSDPHEDGNGGVA